MKIVVCQQCEKSFLPHYHNIKMCSDDCRAARRRETARQFRANPAQRARQNAIKLKALHTRMKSPDKRAHAFEVARTRRLKNIAILKYVKELGIVSTGELQ